MIELCVRYKVPKRVVSKYIFQNLMVIMKVEEFFDWVDNIESYFEWKNVPKEGKGKLAGAKLQGPASTWWKHYQNDHENREK